MTIKPEVAAYLGICLIMLSCAIYLIGSRHYKDGVLGVAGLLAVAMTSGLQVADYGIRMAYFDREIIDVVMAGGFALLLVSRCIRTAYRAKCERNQFMVMTAKQVARKNIIEAL